ncbi:response regulator [Pseudoruegeria sp. HB172150]|uniref:response regulator n=1 Tax=Pseudoruegeria sp. HB172150 TaxID=2721164 RepID=UPI0015540B92|nr:response regulator transcription factor [Pseudoruegeria sp. HB172150]
MSAPKSLLIVEDDPEIRRLVSGLFRDEGFEVAEASGAEEMDRAMARTRPDLVILDLMLPGEDGLSICRRLRGDPTLPIMMLTARGDDIDKVVGLEIGADDYLVKPFNPRELLARVRALLRRSYAAPAAAPRQRLGFAGFVADLDARRLEKNGEWIDLTGAEFELLVCFLQRSGRVLSRDQLLDWVHGRETGVYDRSIDMAVSRLRRKLGDTGGEERLIATIRNAGYLFTATVAKLP